MSLMDSACPSLATLATHLPAESAPTSPGLSNTPPPYKQTHHTVPLAQAATAGWHPAPTPPVHTTPLPPHFLSLSSTDCLLLLTSDPRVYFEVSAPSSALKGPVVGTKALHHMSCDSHFHKYCC